MSLLIEKPKRTFIFQSGPEYRLGFKHSKMTRTYEKYGCEELKDFFPRKFKKLKKKVGLGRVLKVPKRKNGLTSSGKPNQCHSNVRKLVKWKGGKQLLGWTVDDLSPNKSEFIFYFHSVWITPEGKLVDPTQTPKELEMGITKDYTSFIPMATFVNGYWMQGKDWIVRENFKKNGIFYIEKREEGDTSSQPQYLKYALHTPWNMFPIHFSNFTSKSFYGIAKKKISQLDDVFKHGGFSKPSLGTGIYIN